MTKLCLEKYGHTHDIVVVFANTGCEHPATLDFINDCDIKWGFNTRWIEARFNPQKGVGPDCQLVSYETAARNGEPFAGYVRKHATKNKHILACSSTLKRDLIEKYLKSIGFADCKIAIGVRADEIDRIRENPRLVYPLVDAGYTKEMVNAYMAKSGHDLKLPSDAYGNCVWCWKKSRRKLLTLAKESPETFDFPQWIEQTVPGIKMFRGKQTTKDILEQSRQPFEPYRDNAQRNIWELLEIDRPHGGCEESCDGF